MELGQVPLLFSRLPMFPFFDLAHYMASVMALKEQRGERGGAAPPAELRGPRGPWGAGRVALCPCVGEASRGGLCVAHVATKFQPPLALF